MTLKEYVNNAISAAKRDGYNQYITIDKDGEYSIKRKYSNCLCEWLEEKIIAEVVICWNLGMIQTKVNWIK